MNRIKQLITKKDFIYWGELKFPPINLWVLGPATQGE